MQICIMKFQFRQSFFKFISLGLCNSVLTVVFDHFCNVAHRLIPFKSMATIPLGLPSRSVWKKSRKVSVLLAMLEAGKNSPLYFAFWAARIFTKFSIVGSI